MINALLSNKIIDVNNGKHVEDIKFKKKNDDDEREKDLKKMK